MFGEKISASGLILFITILLAGLAGTWLFTAGPGGVNRSLPVTCSFHPATSFAGSVVVGIGGSVNADLPAWAETYRVDFEKMIEAIAVGDIKAAIARGYALDADMTRGGHSINDLGLLFVAKLVALLAAGWLASNILPFVFAFWGMLLLWLLHRAWWSPLSLLRRVVRFMTGIVGTMFYYIVVLILLIATGIILRIWLGGYPDLIVRVTEGLIWSSGLLLVGLACSVGNGRAAATVAARSATPAP